MSTEESALRAAQHALAMWFRGHGYATAARLLDKPPFEVADIDAIRADMTAHGAPTLDRAWADRLLTLWLAEDAPVVRELAGAKNHGYPSLPLAASAAPVPLPGVPGVTVELATDGNGLLAFLHASPRATVDPRTLGLALARHYGLWAMIERDPRTGGENTFRAVAGWVEPPARDTYRTLSLPGASTTPVWTNHSPSLREVEVEGQRVQVLRRRDGNFTRFTLFVPSPGVNDFRSVLNVARNAKTPSALRALLNATTSDYSGWRDACPAAEALVRAMASLR